MAEIRASSRQITIQCEHAGPIIYNHYPRHALWLGVIQIVGGVIMVIAAVASILSGTLYGMTYGNQGFEIVIPLIVSGSFGIAAAKSKAICQINTSMIFSILTAMGSSGVAILMAQALVLINSFENNPSIFYSTSSSSSGRAGYVIMMMVALIEAVVSIVQSVIGCHFSCFCCKKCCCNFDTITTEQIIVNSNDQELQMLLIGSNAPGIPLQPNAPINYGMVHHQMQQAVPQPPPEYSKHGIA